MKQIGFYMLSFNEEQSLIDFLRKDRKVKIVCYRTLNCELDIRDTIPLKQGYDFCCYLWDVDNSPPPVNQYIPTQQHYIIDDFSSELIEFHRSSRRKENNEDILEPGRIAIHHKFWRGTELVERSKTFLAFFEQARTWIKKNAVYRNKIGRYVFPSAVKVLDGGEICG